MNGEDVRRGEGDVPSRARLLFRYVGGDEWREYRIILGVFAGTFFAEFTPDEVAAAVAGDAAASVDPAVIPERLESLRRWGNLTVSSSVGNPASLDDYYRRRRRYLITRAGQEVFELVEGVLGGVDEIGDVQAGRLRDLHRALGVLLLHGQDGFERTGADDLSDTVRTVFDLHERFTSELTQFFAELNLWQSRYDLDADEIRFFAGVLVDYVAEQLTEIERMTRPISRALETLLPSLPELVPVLRAGLAGRVDEAGLAGRVAVRRLAGTREEDWRHLASWFIAGPGEVSRLDRLTRQAVASVRTLTANLTRLSRAGLGATSRRSDFIRLAAHFDAATSVEQAHVVAAAAFGLGACRRLDVPSADADDPVPTPTAWRDAPRAVVPVSLRERGDTTQRGRTTPVRDRSAERERLAGARERRRVAERVVADELLDAAGEGGRVDGARLSVGAFVLLRDLVGRSALARSSEGGRRTVLADGLRCSVHREPGANTCVECPDGRFAMHGLVVVVTRAGGADPGPVRAVP